MERLSTTAVSDAGLGDWIKFDQTLNARYRIPDFPAGARFVAAIADAAESANHHPDVRLSYGVVDVSLSTHDAGYAVTQLDVDLARRISVIAESFDLRSDPNSATRILLALDTANEVTLGPWWSVLLTGSSDNKVADAVTDPTGQLPTMWFQPTEQHAEPRQRWHLDVWLSPEVAPARIAATLALGGRLVDDSEAPTYTVLADPDGNRVCVCTSVGRN